VSLLSATTSSMHGVMDINGFASLSAADTGACIGGLSCLSGSGILIEGVLSGL